MAGVTIIKSGYTDKEIQEIKDVYEPLGFTVTIVGDMKEAVGDEALVCCDLGYLKSMIKSLES